jgi:O-antigen/teichoic acid export membrane protein
MMSYCTPLLGARMTFTSGQHLSKIILGKIFDMTQLGYFAYAYQTVERFVELTNAVSSAMLPTLTQLVVRGERERLRMVFDESLRLIQVLACAVAFLVFAFARELTLLVASPLFERAVPLLRILALVPLFRTTQQPVTMLLQALRLPGAVLRLAVTRFAAEFGSYFALVPVIGLAGACVSNLAGVAVSFGASLALIRGPLGGGTARRVRAQARALGLALPLIAVALVADPLLGHAGGFALRLALIPAGWFGIFALGLVSREDLERVAAMQLQAAPMRRVRDALVSFVDPFLRTIRPWRIR